MPTQKNEIFVGYEVGSAQPVNIPYSHLIVTGVTQLSGKTTTLEALIQRSELTAVVFKTKIGEQSFSTGNITQPFFRDRSDYEFVRSLIEAYAKEKLNIEKGTLMNLCKGSHNLIEIKKRVDDGIAGGKLRGINLEINTRLQHYLENLIPQIQYAGLSNTLNIVPGINIMELERFSEEAQSLIIQSVADEVLKNHKNTIIVIPEAWKFLPQRYNNPCKRVVESFIRQGATNKNFIWLDSQDMSGVDKVPLKQISTWLLGYQSERNEVKHTLDQIPLPAKAKPKEDDIMTLQVGNFYITNRSKVVKTYVQPSWLETDKAKEVALGKLSVMKIEKPLLISTYTYSSTPSISDTVNENHGANNNDELRKQLNTIRTDFFQKISDIMKMFNDFKREISLHLLKIQSNNQKIDMDELVSLMMQKMPITGLTNSSSIAPIMDINAIVEQVLKQIPASSGSVTYTVAPLEKIRKDFLEQAKYKLIATIGELDNDQEIMLRWIEQNGKHTIKSKLFEACFGKSATSGSTYTSMTKKVTALKQSELIRVDTAQRIYPFLKDRITQLIGHYEATPDEIQNTYNHIIAELLN